MNKKKLIGVIICMMMILSSIAPAVPVYAEAAWGSATLPAAIISERLTPYTAKPGDTVHIRIPVKASNYYIRKPLFQFELDKLPFELTEDVRLSRPKTGSSTEEEEVTYIDQINMTFMTFSLKVKDTAKNGAYKIPIKILTTDSFNAYITVPLDGPLNAGKTGWDEPAQYVTINVVGEKQLPSLEIKNQVVPESLSQAEEFSVSFDVTNLGELAAKDVKVAFSGFDSNLIPASAQNSVSVGDIAPGESRPVTAAFTVSKYAQIGVVPVTATISCSVEDGSTVDPITRTLYLEVVKAETTGEGAKVEVTDTVYPKTYQAGDAVKIEVEFTNNGNGDAEGLSVDLTGFSEVGLVPVEAYKKKTVDTLAAGESFRASWDFTASEEVTDGTKAVTAAYTYHPIVGASEESTGSVTLYLRGKGKVVGGSESARVEITDVSYPKSVSAGQGVSVTAIFKNTGKAPAKDVVIDLTGYGAGTLIPVKAYPKKRVDSLGVGKTYTVTYQFTASDKIPDGGVSLTFNLEYGTDGAAADAKQTDSLNIYMDSHAKKEEAPETTLTNSIPKLMVENYDTGTEKLMAGDTFVFAFDVRNTNKITTAENIQVTISSDNGTYSIIEGSASFMIDQMAPGTVEHCTMPLRVKGDVATGGYDVTITFDYEYAGKDNNNNDISKTNQVVTKLKLPVYSNDRPVLSNIRVGDWETPVLYETTTVSFDFNNMGKSPLYNVTAKIVSDDFQPMTEILIIGNVEAGTGKSWTMDVMPQTAGFGTGTIVISYEDGNMNVSEFSQDFESEIQETSSFDEPSFVPDGPEVPQTKQPLLPTWAFILAEAALFLVALFVTRRIVISQYKKKKIAEIEREDEI